MAAHPGAAALPATPTAEQVFTLRVNEAASVIAPSALNLTAGTAHSTVVRTGGFPLPALTVTGALPAGLSFVDAGDGTATLAGTPTAASVGTYSVVAWATNPFGAANTAITIRVVAAPVPVTPSPASGSSSGIPATGGAPESGEFSTSATDDELRSDDDEEQELGDIPTLATDDPAANGAAGEGGDEGGSASDLLLPALLVLLALLGGGVLATVLALRARARA